MSIFLNKYKITKFDDEQIWIEVINDGEGMGVDIKEFEKVVDKFYCETF